MQHYRSYCNNSVSLPPGTMYAPHMILGISRCARLPKDKVRLDSKEESEASAEGDVKRGQLDEELTEQLPGLSLESSKVQSFDESKPGDSEPPQGRGCLCKSDTISEVGSSMSKKSKDSFVLYQLGDLQCRTDLQNPRTTNRTFLR